MTVVREGEWAYGKNNQGFACFAGWLEFQRSEGKGQRAWQRAQTAKNARKNGDRRPSGFSPLLFACTPALRFFCAWILDLVSWVVKERRTPGTAEARRGARRMAGRHSGPRHTCCALCTVHCGLWREREKSNEKAPCRLQRTAQSLLLSPFVMPFAFEKKKGHTNTNRYKQNKKRRWGLGLGCPLRTDPPSANHKSSAAKMRKFSASRDRRRSSSVCSP